jgi:molybdopterin-guanine dinucleotide biosynthesis protein A
MYLREYPKAKYKKDKLVKKTAIIIAGGFSERFGQEKGLVKLAEKPLIKHIIERIQNITEEVIVAVSTEKQKQSYTSLLGGKVEIFLDTNTMHSPLIGALTGLMKAHGDYSVLLPCDTPFVSKDAVKLMFEISSGVDAVIPRWPNGYIEPLQAVYRTSSALAAAKKAVEGGEVSLQSMISLLRRVRYLSTLVIKTIDPQLTTFFNLNTEADLKRAEGLIKRHTKKVTAFKV